MAGLQAIKVNAAIRTVRYRIILPWALTLELSGGEAVRLERIVSAARALHEEPFRSRAREKEQDNSHILGYAGR